MGQCPIAIRALKRFAVDHAIKSGIYAPKGPVVMPAADAQKVAIIGSGPAGLMAGWHLARRGYDVTVFEALDVPGGAIAACIPEYRLPRDLLAADIENIKRVGVKIVTGTRIGTDISFEQLRRDYRAVFIAIGAHKSRKLCIEGEHADGILDSMAFLKDVNLGRPVDVGRRVGIIGGGNSAVDAARVAVRLRQCAHASIIYRRTRVEMPAFEEEIEAAIEEGIELLQLVAPVKVIAPGGKLTGAQCLRMKLGKPDSSGRRRPVPIEGSEFAIDLDTLIVAISEDPDLFFLGQRHGIELSRWGTPTVSPETLATNVEGVFAGGDVVTGPNTVIDAMASGRLAAEMIDQYLQGETPSPEYELVRPSMYVPPVELTEEEIETAARPVMPCLPARQRINSFAEVDLTLTEEAAIGEARRCLRCDLETEHAKQQLERIHLEEGSNGG